MIFFRPVLASYLLLFGLGCQSAEKIVLPTEPFAIVIQSPKVLLESRDIISLSASVVTSEGAAVSNQGVTWTSSNEAIATVSSGGVVSAKVVRGAVTEWTTIRASSAGLIGELAIGIKPVVASRLKIRSSSSVLFRGDSLSLFADVADSSGIALTGRPLLWRVSDPSKATISQDGLLRTQSVGAILIFAELNSLRDSASILISDPAPQEPMSATIAAGYNHTCAVRVDNAVLCWGANGSGQLGDGTTLPIGRSLPREISAVQQMVQVSTGFSSFPQSAGFSCSLATTKEAWCWGLNVVGSVGDGTRQQRLVPTRVSGGLRFQRLVSGFRTNCGLTEAGVIFCWGDGWPLGTRDSLVSPTALPTAEVFRDLSLRWGHICALNSAGKAFCWGDNSSGQLGDGTYLFRVQPTAVLGNIVFSSIITTVDASCGVAVSGQVHCWGSGGFVGRSVYGNVLAPTAIESSVRFGALSGGLYHICGIAVSGQLFCWGGGGAPIGDGTYLTRNVPTPVLSTELFSVVSAGFYHSCAISRSGAAFCWGSNFSGQLGLDAVDSLSSGQLSATTPTRVYGGHQFRIR
jgi:alpha-tubulin suppressor-like RCC1 family protein